MSGFARRADIWRGGRPASPGPAAIPTGFPALDAALPGGGWPLGALTEVLEERQGIGALSLFLPALAHLSRGGRWIAWFSPPYLPYAPALAMAGVELGRVLLVQAHTRDEGLWALEQALRSGACGACLGWIGAADFRVLRRLQLAAEAGRGLGVLFRPAVFAVQHSPAALRLRPGPRQAGMTLQVLKCRGAWSAGPTTLGLEFPIPSPAERGRARVGVKGAAAETGLGQPAKAGPPPPPSPVRRRTGEGVSRCPPGTRGRT